MFYYCAAIVATSILLSAPYPSLASADEPMGNGKVAVELPDDVERKIDEQTEHLPDEIRDKLREKIKERVEQQLSQVKSDKASEAESEDSESDATTEEKEGKESKQEKAGDKAPEKPATDPLSEESKALRTETELIETRFKHKLAKYKEEIEGQRLMLEKSKIDRQLESDRLAAAKAAMSRERDRIKLETEIVKLQREHEAEKLQLELAKLEAQKKRIETEMAVEQAKERLEDRVLGDERYPDEPFNDGVLTVSVRRIELNGPIMQGAADYVCQRLDYFNNHSSKPIFLVIDNCPGGSAIEGMQIVQAIKESRAPVHVVVKRFAASMAAIITTLAEHSYCYPDAIILHHQASTSMQGNGRLLEDQRKMFDEISTRLIGEVAEKIGTSEEEFVEQMYANRASGDWDLFGDQAVERGWVGNVVTLVREDGIRTRPKGVRQTGVRRLLLEQGVQAPQPTGYLERYEAPLVEEVDAQGRPYVRLPSGGPFDAWLLYNPSGYYR